MPNSCVFYPPHATISIREYMDVLWRFIMMKRIILNIVLGGLLVVGVGLQAADMPSQEQEGSGPAGQEQELSPAASATVGESRPAEAPSEVQAQAQSTESTSIQAKMPAGVKAQGPLNESELMSALASDKELQELIKTGIKDLYQQFEGLCQAHPDARPTGDLSQVPADVIKEFETTFSQILSPEEVVKAREILEVVYNTSKKLIPGFDPKKLLTVELEYAKLIMTAIERLMPDLIAVQAKNYTPDVMPGTIRAVLNLLLKGKDARELVGFMNATHTVGLGYLTNGVAALFVESQLPTTAVQKGLSKVKQLFCMGPIDPDDLMEKAADMQVNNDVINMYIKKHVAMYKKHFAYQEFSVADWVLFKESMFEDTPHKNYGDFFLYTMMKKYFAQHGKRAWQELEKEVTWLPGLSTLDGMNFLDATKSRLLILGYKGDSINADSFKNMSHLKKIEIKGMVSSDFTIEDNAFAGLSGLEVLIIDNTMYSKGTWSGWWARSFGVRGPLKLMLTKSTFAGLDNLKYLKVNGVHIPYIVPGTFDAMPGLTVLHLENGGLDTIDADTFKNLTNLKNLYLDNNTIQLVNDRAFAGLSQLTLLSLRNNRLSSLYANQVKDLKKLGFLDIRGNTISKDQLTKLRRGLRKGCYMAFDYENAIETGWRWGITVPMETELKRLNDELSKQEEARE
jgi:hypothetical protein